MADLINIILYTRVCIYYKFFEDGVCTCPDILSGIQLHQSGEEMECFNINSSFLGHISLCFYELISTDILNLHCFL